MRHPERGSPVTEDLQQRISVQNLTIGCCNELQVTPRVLGGRRRTSRRLRLQQAIDNAKQPIPKAKLPTAMPIKVTVCVPLEILQTLFSILILQLQPIFESPAIILPIDVPTPYKCNIRLEIRLRTFRR